MEREIWRDMEREIWRERYGERDMEREIWRERYGEIWRESVTMRDTKERGREGEGSEEKGRE